MVTYQGTKKIGPSISDIKAYLFDYFMVFLWLAIWQKNLFPSSKLSSDMALPEHRGQIRHGKHIVTSL